MESSHDLCFMEWLRTDFSSNIPSYLPTPTTTTAAPPPPPPAKKPRRVLRYGCTQCPGLHWERAATTPCGSKGLQDHVKYNHPQSENNWRTLMYKWGHRVTYFDEGRTVDEPNPGRAESKMVTRGPLKNERKKKRKKEKEVVAVADAGGDDGGDDDVEMEEEKQEEEAEAEEEKGGMVMGYFDPALFVKE